MAKRTARHLMPKKLGKSTGYSDGMREHHSEFKHPGVSKHSEGDAEWRHGTGDDEHMSHPGMAFTTTNPDKATHMTGIHGKHHSGRMGRIHSMLTKH